MTPELILAGLYNAARPQGMGFLHYEPIPMTEEKARQTLTKYGRYFDYLHGRVMKIEITNDGVGHTGLYNRDNGDGTAELVLESLEATGDPNNIIIQKLHQGGLQEAAELARSMLGSKTTMTDKGGIPVMTLGLDDVNSEVEDAVNRATR